MSKAYVDYQEDQKAEALLSPPPEPISIEEFYFQRDVGPGSEVTIRAQLSNEIAGRVSTLVGEETRSGSYFGLFPVTALDDKRAISGLLLSEDFILESDFVAGLKVGDGPIGPVIEINGAAGSNEAVAKQIQRDLEALGRTLPADILTVKPFLDGREIALRPDANKGTLVFGIFAFLGFIYLGYGLFRWYRGRNIRV